MTNAENRPSFTSLAETVHRRLDENQLERSGPRPHLFSPQRGCWWGQGSTWSRGA